MQSANLAEHTMRRWSLHRSLSSFTTAIKLCGFALADDENLMQPGGKKGRRKNRKCAKEQLDEIISFFTYDMLKWHHI